MQSSSRLRPIIDPSSQYYQSAARRGRTGFGGGSGGVGGGRAVHHDGSGDGTYDMDGFDVTAG